MTIKMSSDTNKNAVPPDDEKAVPQKTPGMLRLAKVLEEAISKYFEQAKMQQYADIADVTPVFTGR